MNIKVFDFKVQPGKTLRLHTAGTWVDRDILVTIDLKNYQGDYIIKPSATTDIILPTKETFVGDDITIQKISYQEYQNEYGGYTIKIG